MAKEEDDYPRPGPAIDFSICTCPLCGSKHHHGEHSQTKSPKEDPLTPEQIRDGVTEILGPGTSEGK